MRSRYTDIVSYEKQAIGEQAETVEIKPLWVPKPFAQSPLWQRMGSNFSQEHYLYSCPPVDCGVHPLELGEDTLDQRVLRCPIKKSGSTNFVIPSELKSYKPLIQSIAELDSAQNKDFLESWAHITVERTLVESGNTQRVPGWHVDGFQGVRVPRHAIEHSYLWSDVLAFETCIQPFFLQHLDPARHNVFEEITKQAQEANAYAGYNQHIYLIDPYVVHRSPVMKTEGYRTIVRVTITTTELDDPVNTINLSLDCNQNYPERIDVRNRLYGYEGTVPWELYAIKKL